MPKWGRDSRHRWTPTLRVQRDRLGSGQADLGGNPAAGPSGRQAVARRNGQLARAAAVARAHHMYLGRCSHRKFYLGGRTGGAVAQAARTDGAELTVTCDVLVEMGAWSVWSVRYCPVYVFHFSELSLWYSRLDTSAFRSRQSQFSNLPVVHYTLQYDKPQAKRSRNPI